MYLLQHNFYSPKPIFDGSSNGRYLGNLSEMLIMHSSVFAAVIYASTITLFIWCIWELFNKGTIQLVLALSFFVISQLGYIQHIYVWFAGFINYFPPISLLLLFIVLFKKYIETQKRLPILIYLFIPLIGGLFIEHMTLYQVLIGIIATLLILFMNNKLSLAPTIAYTIGGLISSFIMFSNESYHHASDHYKKVSFSFEKFVDNFTNITHFWIITFNWIIIAIICLSIIVIAASKVKNKITKYTLMTLSFLFAAYYVSINIYIQLNYHINIYFYKITKLNHDFAKIDSWIGVAFVIFLILATFIIFNSFKHIDAYFYLFSFIALAVPFFFILAPMFVREYFSSFIFLFILAIKYLTEAISLAKPNVIKCLTVLFSIFIIVTYSLVMFMMTTNYQVNTKRVQSESFIYKSKLLKKHVPYPEYVFLNDMPIMQSSSYWKNKMTFKTEDYFFNNYYK
ncbi:DUF6056 family protein [Companilactobacillus halodurans]|uniref:YfhO family protein n=1 Tax=Companilactobacillus halodurans TaxID=2584183 RepID=A0A5P0ZVA2_9LACO|nr:DUF6056 family protein [Companilactobacillus halodurans]MQS96959.1 hypothetical protein [Companilactobacillus halodurans]